MSNERESTSEELSRLLREEHSLKRDLIKLKAEFNQLEELRKLVFTTSFSRESFAVEVENATLTKVIAERIDKAYEEKQKSLLYRSQKIFGYFSRTID
ncbi:hypothetical protein MFLO_10288 [Listeria floridensis FSL S10-1187]|uniref:Uncharacterized protein n=1 Tax=Listeria floridensis FSL S10-1187 TaxID=1265817 RepID=A0ABN0RDX5_9LIST|nr:hypothetical protein [Listeria floridensis]EUJ30646.1 hypothetical protein MFLO_10288 [Listeria floridensis FSL S10-1187]